jgi:hypothetical protein
LRAENHRRPVTEEAIGPGRGPRQPIPGESRRMNLNDDVVYSCLRLGPLKPDTSGPFPQPGLFPRLPSWSPIHQGCSQNGFAATQSHFPSRRCQSSVYRP